MKLNVDHSELLAFSDEELKERLVSLENAISVFESEIRDRKNDRNKIIFELKRREKLHE